MATRQLAITQKKYVFSIIWFGQVISVIGSRLSSFALGVWIYMRTGTVLELSLTYFFSALANILLAPVAGVLVDRWDRRWIMIVSDTASAFGTLVIWYLFSSGNLQLWQIYLYVTYNAACDTFQSPAYTAATTLLVPKEHYSRASGVIQLGPAIARIVAPLFAGVLVMFAGLERVLLIDLATFVFAISVMFFVRVPQPELTTSEQKEKRSFREDLAYGWNYLKARPGLVDLLLFYAVVNFTEYMVILLINPLVLSFTTPSVLGVVLSVAGCGMLFGAILVGIWGGPKRRINGLFAFTLLRGALLFLGGLQPNAPLVAIAAFVFLFSGQIGGACSQALWMSKVAPHVQGRVFTLTYLIGGSMVPAAFLLSGPLTDNVMQPLVDVDGPLAGSVGRVIGTGPGRGIGLLLIVLGVINVLMTVTSYLRPRIRHLEDELPDAVADAAPAADRERPVAEEDVKPKKGRARKVFVGVGGVLLVLIIVAVAGGVWFVRRPWPQVSGAISAPGLSAPVEVVRDQWGVPHIYAQNEHDLFFAQGYVHAQERLWQMEANRRISSGTFSEVVGEPVVGVDLFMRTIGLRRAAEQAWAELEPEYRVMLEAYAEGVNAYVQTHRNRLPLEFTVLGVSPAPWTPVDSLTWASLMAYNMSTGHSRRELVRAQVIARLGEEAAQQLFPPTAQDTPVTVPAEAHGYDWLRNEQFERLAVVDEWLGDSFLNWGSNNWVVHGSRTATGKPMLANDMHLDLQMPSVWYENGLHGGRFDGVGFTFPGVPLIVIGHNQHIAWGITNLNADTLDFYLERLDDPEDPTQYEFMGEWHDLDVLEEQIKVRGRDEPIQWDIRFTRNGPLINDVFLDVPEDAQPMSLRWTLYQGNEIFKSIAQINAATNWEQFRAGLEYWDNPGQNFVYADVEGNIGYQATGKLPIRVPEHQGTVPMPGWTDQYDWQGFIPFDELPSVFNPPAGFVASANNKPVPDDYPYLLSYYWVPGFRLRRIIELLDSDELLTVEDMQNMQAQTYSPPAEALRPYLLAIEPENDLQAEALAEVRAWDLYNEIDRVGASIYEVWYRFLVRNTVGDELSQGQDGEALLDRYLRSSDRHVIFLIELMDEADSVWFDDVNTPEVETRENIVRRSLADAVNWLTERYGASTDRWQWGRLHTMTFVHTPLGESGIGLVEYIFNSKTVPAPGGYYMLNMGAWGTDSFEMRFGTSQRFVVDMDDLDNALAVNTTGQSGHLYNSHREDMISMWQEGQYHPLFFTREVVEANAEAVLTLTP